VPAFLILKIVIFWLIAYVAHAHGPIQSTTHDREIVGIAAGAAHIGGAALALLLVAVLVPILEELVFRGFILGGLTRHLSFGWANTWQACLFAILHFDFTHVAFYVSLGLVAGWLVRRTRGLGASIALHVLNNAIATVWLLSAG
jgi:membrane protease YdiL (CAAX protease family)